MKIEIKTCVVTGIVLFFSLYLSPLSAIDLEAESTTPVIFFDDTDEVGAWEWYLLGDQDTFFLFNDNTNRNLLFFEDAATMQLDMRATTFQIEDEANNPIVNVHRDAPLSLDITSNGDVSLAGGQFFFWKTHAHLGIGTTAPSSDLEMKSNAPAIVFSDTSANSTDWYVGNNYNDFIFSTLRNFTGGPIDTTIMTLDAETGNVGMGTIAPTAPLHVKHSDGNAAILVEEINGVQAARNLFVIKNNGNPEFQMINTGNNNSWKFSAGLNFVVKSDSGARVSVLSPAGNLTILGSIFTAGGSCGGGCDRLFDPETEVDSIEDHAAQMWSNSYLPAVGPTKENAPMNLSEKTGGILNELEKAHIYIEQLHTRNLSHEQRIADLEHLVSRLVANQAEQVNMN